MLNSFRSAFYALAVSLISVAPAAAQTPARFPAFTEAQIEAVLGNAYCARTVTTIARTLGETEGWHAYGVRLCGPDFQPVGAIVAWMRRGGQRDFVPAAANGTPLPMPTQSRHVLGDQQSQATIFGLRLASNQPAVCWFSRHNHLNEPFAVAFCQHLDANGQVIRSN